MNELQYFQPFQLVNFSAQETTSYYKLTGDGASVEEWNHAAIE